MGLASVGDDALKHASRCVSFGDQGTGFLCALASFFAVTSVVELDHVVRRGRTSTPHNGNDRIA